MLNLTEIAKRITQPTLCSVDEIDDLKNLCVTYPYSQLFPLLYLSTLARNNDVRFDQELERLAFTISDRSMLYSLINIKGSEEELKTQSFEEPIVIGTKIEAEVQEENSENVVNEIEVSEPSFIQEEVTEIVSIPFQEEEEIKINEEPFEVPKIEVLVEKEPVENDLMIQEFDDSNIDEVVPEKGIVIKESKSFEDLLTGQTIAASYSLEKEEKRLNEIERLKKQLEKPITPSEFTKSIGIESKKSFSSWLTANENYKPSIEEKVDVNDLISKFIEDSPKLKPAQEKLFEGRNERKEFFSPTKKAKESLDEQQLPVSETLAKIFAAQGNFPKAIYAYEQLMLIIPEKKIFFAVQIKELQKKLNN